MGSKSCANLTDVHPSPVYHNKVVLSNLGDCKSLKALLVKLDMSFLKELILVSCSKFKILLEIGESMEHLWMLFLKGISISKLSSSLGCIVGLAFLNLKENKSLVHLLDSWIAFP